MYIIHNSNNRSQPLSAGSCHRINDTYRHLALGLRLVPLIAMVRHHLRNFIYSIVYILYPKVIWIHVQVTYLSVHKHVNVLCIAVYNLSTPDTIQYNHMEIVEFQHQTAGIFFIYFFMYKYNPAT